MNEPCKEPREGREMELAFFAGGDLPAEEAARVESHLAACPACRSFVAGLRASQEGLAALAAEPLDPEALARVRCAVRRRIDDEARRSARRPAWRLALAAGLALALVGAALWLRGVAPRVPEPSPAARGQVVASAGAAEVPRPALPGPPASPAATGPPSESRSFRSAAPPASELPVRRAAAVPAPPPQPIRPEPADPASARPANEPMVIQVVSDDPDIVFYWLVEPEETEDASVSS